MTCVHLPSFDTIEDAFEWLAGYHVVRVVMFRGPDGLVRGSAMVRSAP